MSFKVGFANILVLPVVLTCPLKSNLLAFWTSLWSYSIHDSTSGAKKDIEAALYDRPNVCKQMTVRTVPDVI